jgi:hypothetical protein
VLWRRQYRGELTAATGSVDALGIVVFTADAKDERTQLHSIDPGTGQLRWSKPISCSSPSFGPGVPGQFTLECGTPSIIDAHTAHVIDTPGRQMPRAGSDVYATTVQRADGPTRTDVTLVLDSEGKTIDEISGVQSVSPPNHGSVLLYSDVDGWLLRDYREHQSFAVPLERKPSRGSHEVASDYWLINYVETAWLKSRLIVTDLSQEQRRLHLIDPAHPDATPVSADVPCEHNESMGDLQVVAGAVIVTCRRHETRVVGLVS